MAITGADIPPELFERILDMLRAPVNITETTTDYVRTEKRELGNCAAVCKYWARTCQPKIWISITLRSADDAYQLLAFLKSPKSRVATYIRELAIPVQKNPSAPWLHLLPLIYPNLQRVTAMSVQFEGPIQSDASVRSIHWLLPRAPPAFSANLKTILLHDTHLRCFTHLVHLISELQDVHFLSCKGVTWSGGTPLESIPPKASRLKLGHMRASGCTLDWCALLPVWGLRRRGELPIEREDWVNLIASASVLEHGLSKKYQDRGVSARREPPVTGSIVC